MIEKNTVSTGSLSVNFINMQLLNFYLYKKNVIRIFKIHLKQGQIVDKTAQEKTSHRFMI